MIELSIAFNLRGWEERGGRGGEVKKQKTNKTGNSMARKERIASSLMP